MLRLGKDRVGVITGDKDKGTIKFFLNSSVLHTVQVSITYTPFRKRDNILVIGYEKLRTVMYENTLSRFCSVLTYTPAASSITACKSTSLIDVLPITYFLVSVLQLAS